MKAKEPCAYSAKITKNNVESINLSGPRMLEYLSYVQDFAPVRIIAGGEGMSHTELIPKGDMTRRDWLKLEMLLREVERGF